MLGLLPLYFIGKYFSELAHEHNRSRWLYAVLGIVVFFASQFLAGIILGIILLASDSGFTGKMDLGMNILGIVVGIGSAWLFYYLLKRAWVKNPRSQRAENSDLLDDIH